MSNFIARLSTFACLGLAALPVLGLTQAADAAEPVARVSLADLNLSNPVQAAVFEARVEQAGQALCRAKAREFSLDMSHGACVNEFQRIIERQLNNSQRKALQMAARATPVQVATR